MVSTRTQCALLGVFFSLQSLHVYSLKIQVNAFDPFNIFFSVISVALNRRQMLMQHTLFGVNHIQDLCHVNDGFEMAFQQLPQGKSLIRFWSVLGQRDKTNGEQNDLAVFSYAYSTEAFRNSFISKQLPLSFTNKQKYQCSGSFRQSFINRKLLW